MVDRLSSLTLVGSTHICVDIKMSCRQSTIVGRRRTLKGVTTGNTVRVYQILPLWLYTTSWLVMRVLIVSVCSIRGHLCPGESAKAHLHVYS